MLLQGWSTTSVLNLLCGSAGIQKKTSEKNQDVSSLVLWLLNQVFWVGGLRWGDQYGTSAHQKSPVYATWRRSPQISKTLDLWPLVWKEHTQEVGSKMTEHQNRRKSQILAAASALLMKRGLGHLKDLNKKLVCAHVCVCIHVQMHTQITELMSSHLVN